MKKIILLSCVSVMAFIVLQASMSGVTTAQMTDLTNSPVSSGKCNNCHFGGSFEAALSITVKNSQNEVVSSYIPGETYTVQWNVSSNGASKYGLQATMLKADNSMAGTLTAKSSNTTATNLANKTYIDHTSPPNSGMFEATWVAPAAGSGRVSIYASGLAADGNNGSNNDQFVGTDVITIAENTSGSAANLDSEWKIYPNPVSNMVRVSGKAAPEQLRILALDGSVVLSNQGQSSMDISDLSNGVFILEIQQGNQIYWKKIIK